MRFFLFACFFLTIPGLAKQYEIAKDPPQQFQEYVEQFDASRSPSAVVAGCVHVLTGEYFDSCQDLVTSGSNPIVISRSFSSKNREVGNLYDLWGFNIGGRLDNVDTKELSFKLLDRGSSLTFGKRVRCCVYPVSKSFLKSGVTNSLSPYSSGKSHPMNKRLFYEKGGYWIKAPGNETLYFTHAENTCCRFSLRRLEMPSGA